MEIPSQRRDAVLIGATGLVGGHLLRQLTESPHFTHVTVLGRRPSGVTHAKLTEHIIDFDAPAAYAPLVRGDVLFSALGTTLKRAGSQDAQYRVDYTYQYEVAKAARQSGVGTYVLVSSASADHNSRIFYLRMKGLLERDVSAMGFPRVRILRPGMLDGEREEFRLGERVGLAVLKRLSWLPGTKRLRPVHAADVAAAAIAAALDERPGSSIVVPSSETGAEKRTRRPSAGQEARAGA